MIKVLGLIPARGGSKGLPKKNIASVGGKPLIGWTMEAAAASHSLDRTIVSTDDLEIAGLCRDWGMEVPFMRPPSMAQDDSSHVPVVLHAIEWLVAHDQYKPDYVMVLQPTSPLRSAADIDAAVDLAQSKNAPAVIGVTETQNHPYLVRKLNPDGSLSAFTQYDIDYPRRQVLPKAYAINGAIYLTRCDVLTASRTFEPAGTIPYLMPPERSLDVDTPWDLQLCELILKHNSAQSDPFVIRGNEHAVFGSAYSRADEVETTVRRQSMR